MGNPTLWPTEPRPPRTSTTRFHAYDPVAGVLLGFLTFGTASPHQIALTGLVLATGLGCFITPAFGRLSDIVGRKPVYLVGCLATVFLGIPLIATALAVSLGWLGVSLI